MKKKKQANGWRAHPVGFCVRRGIVSARIGPVFDAFVCADNRENNKAFIAAANPETVTRLLDENARLVDEVASLNEREFQSRGCEFCECVDCTMRRV